MIVYFTGSGNSRDVATRLGTLLNDADIIALEGETLFNADLSSVKAERIVWVFPVYSWGVPPVVADFIRKARLNSDEAAHYLVITCGDDSGLTDRQWRKLIRRRGWDAKGAWSVIMPNTYTLMKGFDVDSSELAEKKLADSVARVEKIAAEIKSESEKSDVVRGSFPCTKSKIIYPWFKRYAMSPKPFHATDNCIGCAKCANNCPMENIAMGSDRRPQWGERCALCLRCYHICPVHAVAYGDATAGKGQYLRSDFK